MNLEKTAQRIIEELGGTENIIHLTHCMTRLRFSLKDESIVNQEKVEAIDGVLGVANVSGIYQVIIGTNVDQMYEVLTNKYLTDLKAEKNKEEKGGIISQALELISSTLSPLIPAIMGAGFISIMLALFTQFNWMTSDSQTYLILNGIANCVYYFFPVLIALSLSSRLKVNQTFAVVTACFLLYPDFINMFSNGEVNVSFMGIPVMFATYSKQIIPIFLSVLAQKYIEKIIYKIIPQVVRTMIASGLILIITILVTIIVIGPFGAMLTEGLNQFVYFVVEKCGWLAIPIMAFINPFLLGTGLGSANFPIMLMSYISNGYEALILPAALAGNAVQAGSGFAISYKTKNKELRSVAFESAITALMGITEPIIFSVHYRLKKTFITVMIGGAIAAILPALTGVACYALATGVLSLPAYLPGGVMNLVWACATLVLGLVIGFVLTWFTKFEDPKDEEMNVKNDNVKSQSESIQVINSPMNGQLVNLETVNDVSFKERKMGEGIAIKPIDGKVFSPVTGEITALFPTHHAIGIRSSMGAEILIHIGIDTVNLNGKYFTPKVAIGDKVQANDLLMEFDLKAIENEGYDVTTPIVITNSNQYLDVFAVSGDKIIAGRKLLTII